jgi:NAD-dependent DNA ligase
MMLQESIVIARSDSDVAIQDNFSLSDIISYLTNTEFLTQIHGIGEKMIKALQAFFHDEININILKNLIDA